MIGTVKVTLSCSFMAKSRCKFCGGPPFYFVQMLSGMVFKDFAIQKKSVGNYYKNLSNITYDYFLSFNPKDFTKLGDFSFTLLGKSYSPYAHKRNKLSKSKMLTDALECKCLKTLWKFSAQSTSKLPEVYHRKAVSARQVQV